MSLILFVDQAGHFLSLIVYHRVVLRGRFDLFLFNRLAVVLLGGQPSSIVWYLYCLTMIICYGWIQC